MAPRRRSGRVGDRMVVGRVTRARAAEPRGGGGRPGAPARGRGRPGPVRPERGWPAAARRDGDGPAGRFRLAPAVAPLTDQRPSSATRVRASSVRRPGSSAMPVASEVASAISVSSGAAAARVQPAGPVAAVDRERRLTANGTRPRGSCRIPARRLVAHRVGEQSLEQCSSSGRRSATERDSTPARSRPRRAAEHAARGHGGLRTVRAAAQP